MGKFAAKDFSLLQVGQLLNQLYVMVWEAVDVDWMDASLLCSHTKEDFDGDAMVISLYRQIPA